MKIIGRPFQGSDLRINSLTTPDLAGYNDLVIITEKRYVLNPGLSFSKARIIAADLMDETTVSVMLQGGISFAVTDDYKLDLIRLIGFFFPEKEFISGVHHTAVIGTDCVVHPQARVDAYAVIGELTLIGQKTHIHAHCVIGNNVRIGNEVIIHPNVTIYADTVIGDRVIIHSGSVIGSDGFGYHHQDGQYIKIPHTGKTVIEDDVEIGSNCSIDRATLGETRIKRGTKMDNLIQIAHNVTVGENTVIAAQAGIAGSTVIGDSVTIAGQAGIVGHIRIGNHVTVGAQAGVIGSVEDGKIISGYPAREHRAALKREAFISKIPEMIEQIRQLQYDKK